MGSNFGVFLFSIGAHKSGGVGIQGRCNGLLGERVMMGE
jgi:hypothetical protein